VTPEMNQQEEMRKSWMAEHLPYEIAMLVETNRLLDWTRPTPTGVILNALIESYSVHARNLIEIFQQEDRASREGSGVQKWAALCDGFKIAGGRYDEYVRMLNNQISHIGYEREADAAKKIDRGVRLQLTDLLRDDLVIFKQHLKPKWISFTLPDIENLTVTSPPFISVGDRQHSASSHLQGTTTTSQVRVITVQSTEK
jgi:hypothetical protein